MVRGAWSACLVVACGFTAGRAPLGGVVVGGVVGPTAEPGFAQSLRGATARALARAGASPVGGPRDDDVAPRELSIVLGAVEHRPLGAPVDGVAEVWRSSVVVRASVAGRRGCSVEVVAEEAWTVGENAATLLRQRADALERIADALAERTVDALAAEPSCRSPR